MIYGVLKNHDFRQPLCMELRYYSGSFTWANLVANLAGLCFKPSKLPMF